MQIQTNTDNHIDGREALVVHVEAVVQKTLSHVRDRVTRVEVHLSDESHGKVGTTDKRCVMEARIQGQQPVAVTDQAGSIHQAVDGAARKLKAALDTTIGRMGDHTRHPAPSE